MNKKSIYSFLQQLQEKTAQSHVELLSSKSYKKRQPLEPVLEQAIFNFAKCNIDWMIAELQVSEPRIQKLVESSISSFMCSLSLMDRLGIDLGRALYIMNDKMHCTEKFLEGLKKHQMYEPILKDQ